MRCEKRNLTSLYGAEDIWKCCTVYAYASIVANVHTAESVFKDAGSFNK